MKPDSRSLGLGDMPDDEFMKLVDVRSPQGKDFQQVIDRLKDQLAEAQSQIGRLGDQNRRLIETQVADAQEIARLREALETAQSQQERGMA